jgi:DNA-3-methyladenine glycosylase II
MFLMFTLHRPDVLPVGDVGIRNAFKAAYGDETVLSEVAEAWRPYRTRASLYLWRSLENTPT